VLLQISPPPPTTQHNHHTTTVWHRVPYERSPPDIGFPSSVSGPVPSSRSQQHWHQQPDNLQQEDSFLDQDDDVPAGAIAAKIEDWVLTLPLGTGRGAAEVEAAVLQRLLDTEIARSRLKQRLKKWMQVAQELQQLVEQQQREIQCARCDDQQVVGARTAELEASNAELRNQLAGATAQLGELEHALHKAVAYQAVNRDLEVARLQQERDAAQKQLAEHAAALSASADEVGRLRRALLDAEIDTQRSSVAAEGAGTKLKDAEDEAARLRCQLADVKANLDAERSAAKAAAESVAAQSAQLTQARAQAAALEAHAAAARRACPGCAERDGLLAGMREASSQSAARVSVLEASMEEQRKLAEVRTRGRKGERRGFG